MGKQYDIPLRLTSPHMTGQTVTDAQWLMAGNGRFEGLATMKDAQIDGDYGLVSVQGCKRAKYWLGYPLASCDGTFGQTVYEYLRKNDWRPLPGEYRTRRAARLKQAQATPGSKALAVAATQIGYREVPRNWQKYGAWFRFNGVPWCAIFESWCLREFWPRFRYASCQEIVSDARWGRNGLRVVYTPIPGDIAVYRLHGDPYAHTAFFDHWIDRAAGDFMDLGGNTGPTNISNGGMVLRQPRSTSMVTAFVRVG